MKKTGWTEKGIVGFIFAPLGLIFLIVGILAHRSIAQPDDRLAFMICFIGLGGVFFTVGLVLLLIDLRRRARLRAAFESGYRVMGKVAGFRVNTRVNVMGIHPTVMEVHWTDPDTGTVHVYFSRYLYVNVQDLLTDDEVPVYIDRDDYRVGFVDVDAVLPKIEVHR